MKIAEKVEYLNNNIDKFPWYHKREQEKTIIQGTGFTKEKKFVGKLELSKEPDNIYVSLQDNKRLELFEKRYHNNDLFNDKLDELIAKVLNYLTSEEKQSINDEKISFLKSYIESWK